MNKKIPFTKMHGLGNDFAIFDNLQQQLAPYLTPSIIRAMSHRNFGIGFDQLLVVEPSQSPSHHFRYRIFNANGGEVEQCGNGARCFAQYVIEKGLHHSSSMLVETQKTSLELTYVAPGQIRVNMGIPDLTPEHIPFTGSSQAMLLYPLEELQPSLAFSALSMGNPHAVFIVPHLDQAPLHTVGTLLNAQHPFFPAGVNVGFMEITSPHQIRLRVHERGAGETLACGTGAAAAVAAGILQKRLSPQVTVHTRGGALKIEWAGPNHPLYMVGPAVTVFEGVLDLSMLHLEDI